MNTTISDINVLTITAQWYGCFMMKAILKSAYLPFLKTLCADAGWTVETTKVDSTGDFMITRSSVRGVKKWSGDECSKL